MPVMLVPRSSATVAIETFITELSSIIRNWPVQRVSRMRPAPALALRSPGAVTEDTSKTLSGRGGALGDRRLGGPPGDLADLRLGHAEHPQQPFAVARRGVLAEVAVEHRAHHQQQRAA